MFLELTHTKLDIFKVSREFVLNCYKITKFLPAEERFNLTQQIRRASLSVYLNIAEGASRKSSTERKRFYEIARGSIIEIDAAFDIIVSLHYITGKSLKETASLMIRCFQMLSRLISNQKAQNLTTHD